jgi:Na+/H+ antiporter NhaC
MVLSVMFKALTVHEAIEAMEEGFRPMFGAVIILTFAWAIADINKALHTADFIVSWLGDGMFEAGWLPIIIFIIAALCSFATGTSWGTIGILVPLVLPLASTAIMNDSALISKELVLMHPVMLASLAAVLGGAVWGDHCSPISDTTILSSVASGCDHIAHVRTQMPYAMVVSVVAVMFGMIPVLLLGVPLLISFVISGLILYLIVRFVGK